VIGKAGLTGEHGELVAVAAIDVSIRNVQVHVGAGSLRIMLFAFDEVQ
jgi:hypothetical protein